MTHRDTGRVSERASERARERPRKRERERERETDRQTDRQTDRKTDRQRQRQRQTDRQTYRGREGLTETKDGQIDSQKLGVKRADRHQRPSSLKCVKCSQTTHHGDTATAARTFQIATVTLSCPILPSLPSTQQNITISELQVLVYVHKQTIAENFPYPTSLVISELNVTRHVMNVPAPLGRKT